MCTLCASEQGKPALDEDSGRLGIQNMDGWVRSDYRLSAKCLISRKLFAHDENSACCASFAERETPVWGGSGVASGSPLQEWEWMWNKRLSHF